MISTLNILLAGKHTKGYMNMHDWTNSLRCHRLRPPKPLPNNGWRGKEGNVWISISDDLHPSTHAFLHFLSHKPDLNSSQARLLFLILKPLRRKKSRFLLFIEVAQKSKPCTFQQQIKKVIVLRSFNSITYAFISRGISFHCCSVLTVDS